MISRRNFLGKALKSLALVVVAPTLIAKYPVPALPQPGRPGGKQDKGEVIKFKKYDSPGKIAVGGRFNGKEWSQKLQDRLMKETILHKFL